MFILNVLGFLQFQAVTKLNKFNQVRVGYLTKLYYTVVRFESVKRQNYSACTVSIRFVMSVYCSTFEGKTSNCFYTGVYTCRLYCESVNRTSGVNQLLLADVLANLTGSLLTLRGATTFRSRKNGCSHALLYFNCQCVMPAPASD